MRCDEASDTVRKLHGVLLRGFVCSAPGVSMLTNKHTSFEDTPANVRGGAITHGVAITHGNPPNPAKMVNFTILSYNGEENEWATVS
jgi:hypothetical protein